MTAIHCWAKDDDDDGVSESIHSETLQNSVSKCVSMEFSLKVLEFLRRSNIGL
jgi:hypothetical protein